MATRRTRTPSRRPVRRNGGHARDLHFRGTHGSASVAHDLDGWLVRMGNAQYMFPYDGDLSYALAVTTAFMLSSTSKRVFDDFARKEELENFEW